MSRLTPIIIIVAATLLASGAETPQTTSQPKEQLRPASAPTVDQVIQKYLEGAGGEVSLRKLNSRVSKATVSLSVMPGVSGSIEIYEKAPNKTLTVLVIPNLGTQLQGFDGETAWAQDQVSGLRTLGGAEAAQVKRDAVFYKPVKLKELYPKMSLKGTYKVGSSEVYVIEATPTDGTAETWFVDTADGRLLREDTILPAPIGKTETYFEDFRLVDGVKRPFIMRQVSNALTVTFKFSDVKHNIQIDDSRFTKPKK